jgi:hypothetical protein
MAWFLKVLWFACQFSFHKLLHILYIIRGWYSRPISDRRTKWTQSHPAPRDKKRTEGVGYELFVGRPDMCAAWTTEARVTDVACSRYCNEKCRLKSRTQQIPKFDARCIHFPISLPRRPQHALVRVRVRWLLKQEFAGLSRMRLGLVE